MTAERPADVAALTAEEWHRLWDAARNGVSRLGAAAEEFDRILAARVAAAYAEGYEAGRAEVTAAVEAIAGDEHGWLCSTNPNLDGPGGPCDCLIGGVRAALASPSSVLADITDEARAEGYEAGYAEGYADGRDPP